MAGVGCLPQCPWELFLMAPNPSSRTIPKWVSFEHASCNEILFLGINKLYHGQACDDVTTIIKQL
jgi:hypothetical protein